MSLFAAYEPPGPEIILRPYQEECLEVLEARLGEKKNVLLEMATGGGKTIVFSFLIKRILERDPDARIAVSAHRQELVTQAKEKLFKVWPESYGLIGTACASLERVETDYSVVIGSVQTLARRSFPRPVDLLIIDEVHRVPRLSSGKTSQYRELIGGVRDRNPDARVLGVTATPYRLDRGRIYGREGDLFDRVDYRVGLDDLMKQGYLVRIRAKETARVEELSEVGRGADGDYKTDHLSRVMTRGVHLSSAVTALRDYGEGRRNALAFAVTIEHAELMARAFRGEGVRASAVHSGMDDRDRRRVLADFEAGRVQVLVNVGVLTEGWDSPRVDLILMTRPTLSPGLFVQMVGRGTRLSPETGKENLLILDLVGNFRRHGVPWDPKIGEKDGRKKADGDLQLCPRCLSLIEKELRICPECGHVLAPSGKPAELAELEAAPLREILLDEKASVRVLVVNWKTSAHLTRRGMMMLKVDVRVTGAPGHPPVRDEWIAHYLDIEGTSSEYGGRRAALFWYKYGSLPAPRTVGEALSRSGELNMGGLAKLSRKKGWVQVEW